MIYIAIISDRCFEDNFLNQNKEIYKYDYDQLLTFGSFNKEFFFIVLIIQ